MLCVLLGLQLLETGLLRGRGSVQRATLKREVPVVSCVCWAPQCPSPLVGSELYFGHSDWELEK